MLSQKSVEVNKIERRRRSAWYHIKRIFPRIWTHPRNQKSKVWALAKTLFWQFYKRIFSKPLKWKLTDGVRIICYPDSTCASNVVYFGGLYDYHEMNFIRDYLRPGDSFLDCGANIGVYTLLAASCVGPAGKGFSFEPFPGAYKRLEENLRFNGYSWVETYPAGVSSKKSTGRLSAKLGVANRLVDSESAGDTVEVPLLALDDVVGAECLNFAKVDVEGAELEAFQGAVRMFGENNPPVWLFELLEGQLAKQGAKREQVCQFLEENGYGLYIYDSDSRELQRAPDGSCGNIWAISHARLDEVKQRVLGA